MGSSCREAFILRGIVAILFGIVVLWQPRIGLEALVIVFGAHAIFNGITLEAYAWQLPSG
jgi:uncharacterized membrane protein HdeD (DUF308 family)